MFAATQSRFCVFVGAENGYLTILGSGELHPLAGFSFGKYGTQEATEARLNLYLSTLFRKQRFYEMVLPMPGNGTPPAVPAAAATISGKTMNEAVANLKKVWPDCPDCDNFITTKLGARLGNLKMTSDTPLLKLRVDQVDANILAFDLDAPASGLNVFPQTPGTTATLTIGFDRGAAALDSDGVLLTGAAVRQWGADNFEGRFWTATDISDHFTGFYQAVGLNPSVFVSLAGQKRSITITESSRIARIIFPGDGQGKIDPNADKLAYSLLRTEQWAAFKSISLPAEGGGAGFVLCLPLLSGGKCTPADGSAQQALPDGDTAQRSLDYLSAFWLAERTAALQSLGYGVAAVNEPAPPGVTRTSAVDLNVQKLGNSSDAAASGQSTPPAQSPGAEPATTADLPQKPAPASVAGAPQIPGAGKTLEPSPLNPMAAVAPKIDPARAGTTPPVPKDWIAEYGAVVQYRPNQPVRVLLAAQSQTVKLGAAVLSASGQAGTDGTKALGNGNINADWLWFDKIHRRLQFQFTGSTDATTKRILGGAYTDERRVGGNAHAELEIFRENRGFKWNLFAEPRRESVSLSRTDRAAGGGNLSTVTVGSGIVYNQWITAAPVRFALNTQTRVGTGLGAEPTYAVFDLDGGLHRRISDQYLISADISGRFQLASSMTPVFDLPSLGGGESVRGFQTDDALGRKLWSLQSELWAPVPFTLAATQQSGGARWFLRQNVRLAGFFDAGGVWDTNLALSPGLAIPGTSALPGFRKGAGAGIRFIQGPITLKFDWAYGFGHGAFGDGHGRFYIGVSTNGSF